MKTAKEAKSVAVESVNEDLHKRNPDSNSDVEESKRGEKSNAAVVHQVGDQFAGRGVRDIDASADAPGNGVDENTMFAEGSIGKIRYAGLAYMMDEAGIFGGKGLEQNAAKFFSGPEVKGLLDEKYPGKNMQTAILGLFTGGSRVISPASEGKKAEMSPGSKQATLADLTTHRSGIGDTTSDTLNRERQTAGTNNAGHSYSLPDFVSPHQYSVVKRGENGKPQAKKGLNGDPARAIYGDHEYSNLGYQILAEAMELAYEMETGDRKTYQTLTEDFMLHPIEGRAVDKSLSFDHTKFPGPNGFAADENVIQGKMMEVPGDLSKGVKEINGFNGAGAAGGIFASAGDSAQFFTQYFKGFPGTQEYGQEGFEGNPFFSKETIEKMTQEALKHESAANQPTIDVKEIELAQWNGKDDKPAVPNSEYQFPGVVLTTDSEGEPVAYGKGGGTSGYNSSLSFTPADGENGVDISMIYQENVTPAREKEVALAKNVAGEVAPDDVSNATSRVMTNVEKLGLEGDRDRDNVASTHVERLEAQRAAQGSELSQGASQQASSSALVGAGGAASGMGGVGGGSASALQGVQGGADLSSPEVLNPGSGASSASALGMSSAPESSATSKEVGGGIVSRGGQNAQGGEWQEKYAAEGKSVEKSSFR